MSLKHTLTSLSALALALTACAPMAPAAPGAGGEAASLAGTLWTLTGYGQPATLTPPLAEAPATLDITADRLIGTTGCNFYGYDYRQEGATLVFGEPRGSMTLMACDEPRMRQEAEFIRILDAVTGFVRAGDQLTLTGPEGVLVFAPAASATLEGTTWQLNGLASQQAVVSQVGDEALTLTLAEGRASGFAGCNTYFGAYTLEAAALSFGELGATKMACPGEAGAREAEFLAALGRVAGYQISRTQLTLLDAAGQTVMVFAAAP